MRLIPTDLDGNNVDIDTENVELASEQLRYQTLTSAVKRMNLRA